MSFATTMEAVFHLGVKVFQGCDCTRQSRYITKWNAALGRKFTCKFILMTMSTVCGAFGSFRQVVMHPISRVKIIKIKNYLQAPTLLGTITSASWKTIRSYM